MKKDLVPSQNDLFVPVGSLPAMIVRAGPSATGRFVEFFAASIRNSGTREVYARAVARFCHWCERRSLGLADIHPLVVAAYIEQLSMELGKPTVKQHLAAIRMLFDYLVTGQVVPVNPAASVRGPKHGSCWTLSIRARSPDFATEP